MYFYISLSSNDLVHYGVKGMHWGIRRYQPYSTTGARKGGKTGKEIGQAAKTGSKNRSSASQEHFSGEADILVMAVGLVGSALLARGSKYVTDKIRRNSEQSFNKNVTSESDLPKKKNESSAKEDLQNTNPNYNSGGGYIYNCMYCSTVYDLRRRGYDVTARPRSAAGGTAEQVASWYKGAVTNKYQNSNEAFAEIKKQPEGSRGNICASGRYGGHSVAYEVHNGNVEILDGQSGKSWSLNDFSKRFDGNYYVTRTDNCEPNWDKIGETIDPTSLRKR